MTSKKWSERVTRKAHPPHHPSLSVDKCREFFSDDSSCASSRRTVTPGMRPIESAPSLPFLPLAVVTPWQTLTSPVFPSREDGRVVDLFTLGHLTPAEFTVIYLEKTTYVEIERPSTHRTGEGVPMVNVVHQAQCRRERLTGSSKKCTQEACVRTRQQGLRQVCCGVEVRSIGSRLD